MKYCDDRFNYQRRKTRVVMIGEIGIGGNNPIRVQSMTISDTLDTKATADEIIQLVEVGCEIVRVTAPSIREAENIKNIKNELSKHGVKVPLVADIHYTPNAALIAAEYVEKVRINPGNYVDKKKFEQREYSDEKYLQELLRVEEKFKPLVLKCRQLGRAMRIGANHGSLSDRIMNRYGDTPQGMVESALEFVRICQKYDFHDIILSMKSSNPKVAIQAYRLLAARMNELGMDYPFHLGVTEAGGGEEGRIKSAIGIGALLEDGIGDTIRVSLTEDSIAEIPVAFQIVQQYNDLINTALPSLNSFEAGKNGRTVKLPDSFEYVRRNTLECDLVFHQIGSKHPPRVEMTLFESFSNLKTAVGKIAEMSGQNENGKLALLEQKHQESELKCETVHIQLRTVEELIQLSEFKEKLRAEEIDIAIAVYFADIPDAASEVSKSAERLVYSPGPDSNSLEVQKIIQAAQLFDRAVEWAIPMPKGGFLNDESQMMSLEQSIDLVLNVCKETDCWNILFSLSAEDAIVYPYRYLAACLDALGANIPLLLRYTSNQNFDTILLDASNQLGALLCDGIGDAIHIDANLSSNELLRLSYNILQATRLRISKTDYISCPSCGRTLFDLQTTTERIKSKTGHLKGVKIAIMGCIVNGPGEMADADFGYVGAGPQKVNLFVGKECVKRNIPEDMADSELIELIKAHGKWVEPQRTFE